MSPKDILVDNIFWKNIHNPQIKDTISNIHIQYCRTIPKVYRINYEIQSNSLAIQAQEEIPDFFKNPGIEDITNLYIVCKDIEIPLWENMHRKKHIYLCCYDSEKWIPVCWSKTSKKKVKFKQIGVNVLYMPAYYHNKEIIPAGDIFTITTDGNIKFFQSTPKSIIKEATFYSKMPYRIHTALQAASTLKTQFFVCNKRDLSDSILIHTIDRVPFYKDSFKIKTNDTFRYLVCNFQNIDPSEDPFSIAEIKFFDEVCITIHEEKSTDLSLTTITNKSGGKKILISL